MVSHHEPRPGPVAVQHRGLGVVAMHGGQVLACGRARHEGVQGLRVRRLRLQQAQQARGSSEGSSAVGAEAMHRTAGGASCQAHPGCTLCLLEEQQQLLHVCLAAVTPTSWYF